MRLLGNLRHVGDFVDCRHSLLRSSGGMRLGAIMAYTVAEWKPRNRFRDRRNAGYMFRWSPDRSGCPTPLGPAPGTYVMARRFVEGFTSSRGRSDAAQERSGMRLADHANSFLLDRFLAPVFCVFVIPDRCSDLSRTMRG